MPTDPTATAATVSEPDAEFPETLRVYSTESRSAMSSSDPTGGATTPAVQQHDAMYRQPATAAPWWSRVLCFIGFHPYERLTDKATCGDCGRFML